MLRVKFMAHCDEVMVKQYGNPHLHEEETDQEHQGVNFRWTDAMTDCIQKSLKNESTVATIVRNLKDLNLLPNENDSQLSSSTTRSVIAKILSKSDQIFTTAYW